MRTKNRKCIGKYTGMAVQAYGARIVAQEAADYANLLYGRNYVPYFCDKCRKWHLSPKNRQTPSTTCRYCVGRDGKNKKLYESRASANMRASIACKEQGVYLMSYPCHHSTGWHLTRGRLN